MKKIFAMILSVVMIASLTACGSKETPAASAPAASVPAASVPATSTNQNDLKWPNETITIYCGYSAGGSSDLLCRYMANALQKELGVSVIVENVPGSNSWQLWNSMIQTTAKDGNHLCLVNTGILTGKYDPTNPREYGMSDFEMLASQVVDYEGAAIRINEDRFNDMESFIAYAQENPVFISGTSGYFSGDKTIATYFNDNYGTQIEHVPVDGAGDQRTMFLAGDTDILFGNVSDLTASGNGSEWKIVATFSEERTPFTPDVPTLSELNLGDYIGYSVRGFAYADGVDEAIVEKMQQAMLNVSSNDAEYLAQLEAMGSQVQVMVGDEWTAALEKKTTNQLAIMGIEYKG